MIINLNQFGGGGAGGHDSTKLDVTAFNTYTQEQATIDESQNTAIDDIETDITGIKSKIEDIELFKFPNVTIIGEPTIQNGQVSDFSTVNYLQFPFIVDLHNKAFEINFCFTTATNVQTQQNILDSKFGLALAIKDGKGLMAISSNGTSWNIGNTTGTMNIEPNTTYYAKLTWNGIQYKTALSTNGEDYTEDMVLVGAQAPHPTTIFIGGCDTLATGHDPHPFLGTINLNNANLIVSGNVIWSGMDDAGLATRMATDMSNIDEAGIEKVKEIVAESDVTLKNDTIVNITKGGKELVGTVYEDFSRNTGLTIENGSTYEFNGELYFDDGAGTYTVTKSPITWTDNTFTTGITSGSKIMLAPGSSETEIYKVSPEIHEQKELETYVNDLIDIKLGPVDTALLNILGE